MRQGPCVVIGTTDTSYAGGADVWPEITREDVEYLLEPPGRYLRGAKLAAGDVIGAWAGLRPLIAQPGKRPSEISRRDEVLVGPANVDHAWPEASSRATGRWRARRSSARPRSSRCGSRRPSPRIRRFPAAISTAI